MAERLIFHVDVNSAFLSWEAMRRMREGGSDLRLVPSAVGGDRDKRTGIILAKSVPAKKYGVKTGEPVGMALNKCPSLVIVKPDFHLYSACSRAFIAVCRRYAPVVEQYSIDECFLDMTGTSHLYPDPVALADEIRAVIRSELGFTVNVGIGSNKLLAKTAGDFEKPDKTHTLFTDEIPAKLWPLPADALLYVGKATAEKLNHARLFTVGDVAAEPLEYLQRLCGEKGGLMLHRYSHGLDESPVREEPEAAKGYSTAVTLEENITDRAASRQVLLALVDSVCARMRKEAAYCRSVGVTVRDTAFKNTSHQKKLMNPTDVTSEIASVTVKLLEELWDGETPLRLLGVSLGEVTYAPVEQLSLFPDEKKEKARALDKAMDAIRQKYGADTIFRGSTIETQPIADRKHKDRSEEEKR